MFGFDAVGGASRSLSLRVMSMVEPPLESGADANVALRMSRLSMFWPMPPGGWLGASPLKSATCGPGPTWVGGGPGGGDGAPQPLTTAAPALAEPPVPCRGQ